MLNETNLKISKGKTVVQVPEEDTPDAESIGVEAAISLDTEEH